MSDRQIEGSAAEAGPARGTTPEMIGQHPVLERVRSLIRKIAATDATVLVEGESGTGKEVVARMLHAGSSRAQHPFVAVNCGAIPAELLESEMFGHERGAFTGALGSRPGLFQLAHRGTIFLDEIGEMSAGLQVKLLRVLQEREVRPVGSDRSVKVDVRIIAATNKDLQAEVASGRFREDLYYRLNVVPVTLPPLRERRSDIPLLVEHFLAKHVDRHRHTALSITDDAMVRLWEHSWPGNVRELENLIERVVILAENEAVEVSDLPASLRARRSPSNAPTLKIEEWGGDLHTVVKNFELGLIADAMSRTGGNKRAAAVLLGVNRTTLIDKLRRCEERPLAAAAAS